MDPKIETISGNFCLGEGPHWDLESQSLYFVDCVQKNLIKYAPATDKISKVSVAPKQPTFIIPIEGTKDQFIISLDKELVIITWDGESEKIAIVEQLCSAENPPEAPDNRFNDGKCDPIGRLWTGTYGVSTGEIEKTPPTGVLFSFSFNPKERLKKHVENIHISNGLTFNEKLKKLYHIDSLKGSIDQFDLDIINGTIANRRVLFTLKKHNISGFPDGMTIDTEGNLWVAVFEGSRILKIHGRQPETLLESIELPAVQVTSLTFGGQNLDELYVTTASIEFRGTKPPPPANGALYKITEIGATGFPGVKFKLY